MTTKRARKKESTMINNQARKKEIAKLEERVTELEGLYEGLSEWVADIDATVMIGTRKFIRPRGKRK